MIWPVSLNTYWTVTYAFLAMDLANESCDEAAFFFDVAVSGGIVFG